jgi:hypothetical protein
MLIIRVIIVFFILFNFPIPVVYNSAILAFLISLSVYIYDNKKLNELIRIFSKKYVFTILLSLLFIIVLSFIPALLHRTFDFNIIKVLALQLFLLTVALFSFPILCSEDSDSRFYEILELLILAFLLQSVIQCFAFSNIQIRNFINFFQKESITDKEFGGIRALALSGNPFFDLSAAYGLVYILFIKNILDKKGAKFNTINSIVFLVLFVGTFFAGRTGFVGFSFAVVLYLFNYRSFGKRLRSLLKLLFLITAFALIIYLFIPASSKELIGETLLPFAFEFIYNYMDEGKFSTESTDVLSTMYFPISWKTFLLGDGKYLQENGLYYMETDAGYMRQILFYGVFGLFVFIFYQLQFFRTAFKIIISNYKFNPRQSKSDFLFFGIILTYLMVIHYKGEVIGFLPITQIILFWICFSFILDRKINIKKSIE